MPNSEMVSNDTLAALLGTVSARLEKIDARFDSIENRVVTNPIFELRSKELETDIAANTLAITKLQNTHSFRAIATYMGLTTSVLLNMFALFQLINRR